MSIKAVEAFAASWIEIIRSEKLPDICWSKPLRLRGLKFSSLSLLSSGLFASKPLRLRGLKSDGIDEEMPFN